MKLRELLVGSVAAAAIAGVASANDLTFETGTAELVFASELTVDSDGSQDFVIHLTPSSGAYLDTNQIVTVTLGGGAVVAAGGGITLAGVDGDASSTCDDTNVATVSGAGVGDGDASFLIDTASGCLAAAQGTDDDVLELTFTNIEIPNGTDVSVTVNVTTEAGTNIGGGSDSIDIASWAPAFVFAVDADATATTATLASSFDDLAGAPSDDIIGEVTVAHTARGLADHNQGGGASTTAAGDLDELTTTVTGDFSGFTAVNSGACDGGAGAGGADADTSDGVTLLSGGGATNQGVCLVEDADAATVIIGGGYTASFVADLDGTKDLADQSGSGALQSVDREGTDLAFGWALGTAFGQTGANQAYYRVSNNSSNATGPVTVTLLSQNSGSAATATSGTLTIGGTTVSSIAANSEINFRPQDLVDVFGGDFVTGDLMVTIEGDDVSGQYAVINADGTTNYAVTERN